MLTGMFTAGDPTRLKKIGVEQAIGQIEIPSGGTYPAGTYTVYEKTFYLNALPNASSTSIPFDENYVGALNIFGSAISKSNSKGVIPMPYVNVSNVTYQINIYMDTADNIRIYTGNDVSAYCAYITIQYFR